MVQYGYVRRCVGQWVVCHTRQGDLPGRLLGCNPTHLFLQAPRYAVASSEGSDTPNVVHSIGHDSGAGDMTVVSYYGYGGGRTVVALASVVGLTAIGLSALWW